MIFYVVTATHRYTIDAYLQTWGRALMPRVRVLPHEQLEHRRWFQRGTYVFADLERLSAPRLGLAAAVADGLAAGGARVLNHPARALRRYDLLRALHAAGINRFNAHRLADRAHARLPAFLRVENDHTGSLTPLLNTRDEVDKATAALDPRVDRGSVIAVEYCHTADGSGTFRKYAAVRVGDRTIPRHVLFSPEWVDKHPDVVTDAYAAEEAAYVATHPHAAALDRIFEIARIDFGRIDYSVLDGAVQAWEINTNPTITMPPGDVAESRLAGQARASRQITEAMDAIDTPTAPPDIRVTVPRDVEAALGVGLPHRVLRAAGRAARRAERIRPVGKLLRRWDRLMDAYVRY